MSAPAIDRRATTGTAPARESGPRRSGVLAPPRIPAQRATERIAERIAPRERARAASRQRAQVHAGRAKFVLVVMTLLVCGLVATLWLSTAAAADSYRLQEARTRAGSLTEQSEQLRKQVTAMNSPSALAQRAAAQGLVSVQDPARLVVAPDGRVDVVGDPTPARGDGPTPPAVPAPAAPQAPAGPAAGVQTPATQAPSTQAPATPAPSTPTPATQAPAARAAGPAQADTSDPAAAAGATTAGGQG